MCVDIAVQVLPGGLTKREKERGIFLTHRVVVEDEGVYIADEETVDECVGQHLHALGRAVRVGQHQPLHRAARHTQRHGGLVGYG